MGQKIIQIYDFVNKNGGLQAQMRLAMKTGCPSSKAATVADTPDLIQKFKVAVKEITGKDVPNV